MKTGHTNRGDLDPNLLHPTRSMEYADDGLVASVVANGIQVPLQVYTLENKWFVLDGHRRLKAALSLAMDVVPVLIMPAPVEAGERLAKQMVINSDRKGMSYLDQARVYADLVHKHDWLQKDVAEKFGKSASEISLALASLKAHPVLQEAINSGKLQPSAIEPLLSQPIEVQAVLADAAKKAKTVRRVTALVKAYHASKVIAGPALDTSVKAEVDPLEIIALDQLREVGKNLDLLILSTFSTLELREEARRIAGENAQKLGLLINNLNREDL